MRIVSLKPFLTELVLALGLPKALVGVSDECVLPEELNSVPRIAGMGRASQGNGNALLEQHLSASAVSLEELVALQPEIVLTTVVPHDDPKMLASVRNALSDEIGKPVKLFSADPTRLETIFSCWEELGKIMNASQRAHDLSQRIRAQCMDWSDSFYERMKNKKVTFLTAIDPPTLGGLWLPDLIQLASAQSQFSNSGAPHHAVRWEDIIKFRPDVIIVAPQKQTLEASLRLFPKLEKLPDWEAIPAVKRGEVIFTDGINHFYRPTPALMESMAILISAIAGLESGYITPRDSFYRLRWLELRRHTIK